MYKTITWMKEQTRCRCHAFRFSFTPRGTKAVWEV